jgi:uronate dehydrogenase
MTGAAGGFGEALRHRPGVRRWCSPAPTMSPVFIGRTKPSQRTTPPRPDGFYRLSKAFGKDLARLYLDRHGIETAASASVRLLEPKDRGMLATWLSDDDLHRLITSCLTTPMLGHSIVFGMSANAMR